MTSTPKRTAAQGQLDLGDPQPDTRSIKTFLERDNWMRAVLADPRPSLTAKNGAVAVALILNVKLGRCDASYETVGKAMARGARTAMRAVAELVELGWLAEPESRGRHWNNFRFLWPSATVTPYVTVDAAADVTVDPPNRDRIGAQPCHLVSAHKRTSKRTSKKEGNIYTAPLGDAVGKSAAAKTETRATGRSGERVPSAFAPKGVDSIDTLFAAFWSAYPRKCSTGAARRAFARAVDRGADPRELVAAAKRYAIERAAAVAREAVQALYTLGPARWLDDECWNDQVFATMAKTIDQAGNPVAFPQVTENRPRDAWDIAADNVAHALWGGWHGQQH
jgi:hypothetical protein